MTRRWDGIWRIVSPFTSGWGRTAGRTKDGARSFCMSAAPVDRTSVAVASEFARMTVELNSKHRRNIRKGN